ncbi:DUF676-domain-containing protein [Lentithecium fluviatile CBS 122367]|uniref:DUF676-domain-containing protein n=1 Tax=Lentithecium fluviatile CBS 122367 TaxID=1168545 RepID=A0A6G1J9W9_9PLEO|nr:DUF676-domain-containing protein [Lentithecium fluviatile CBS 122367]
MLLTPRTYSLAQTPDAGFKQARSSYFTLLPSRKELQLEERRARKMLLLHQTGVVKVGEVVRYTVTYTPSEDRILPSPAFLHVRVRNTSAMPLRAAYLHGPYTIHVAAYPSTFNPNKKVESPKKEGVPEFEPNLKAGGYWTARLVVPENIRESGGSAEMNDGTPKSATWIIEIASQIIFSNSASVSYELLVARDERSLDLGFTAVTGNTHGVPGQVQDHQQGKASHTSRHAPNPKGVYSKAVKLVVDDTTSLWNKPELPEWKEEQHATRRKSKDSHRSQQEDTRKQKKIHLVIVTHGLHSNLGADMLYLKESIDATARQAREDRKRRRREEQHLKPRDETPTQSQKQNDISTAQLSGGQDQILDEDDDEEVVVRGFDKNVIRTERGIQYLGKRLAKFVLEMTYPDQPYLPIKKPKFAAFSPVKDKADTSIPAHAGSSIHHPTFKHEPKRAYTFTSISFVGHSLGGLVQTYAIAYIYKHSPQFFEKIKPINFITMASPFLGLSNENPMYIKFALDFGLVGRTGQDLGLTWRAPTVVRSGWTAMVSGLGGQSQHEQDDPGAKPLLRILPTGPAHVVLRMFRNRTVYSNVVNDGIVPLRTSCLLFLDWRGLGKVEKARRENGLIGTVAVWGFGQLTGQNTSPNPSRVAFSEDDNNNGAESPSFSGDDTAVPQPSDDIVNQDDEAQAAAEPSANQWLDGQKRDSSVRSPSFLNNESTLMQLWSYIRPSGKHTSKDKKMFKRSQTVAMEQGEASDNAEASSSDNPEPNKKRPQATRGDSLLNDPNHVAAPPKTTIFESAGDLLSPPVPPQSWIIDPSTRARTIFHDRVYHPEDIPPPLVKKKATSRSFSGESTGSQQSTASTEEGGIRVEEKIARAYHRDLSWRKVLVRLEPDAHNNIVVRRMFANAYGWPVVKHLCDTHFADTYSASTRDENEPAVDRAKGVDVPVKSDGEHVKGQESIHPPVERTESELRESADELAPLNTRPKHHHRLYTGDSTRSRESTSWDDMYFEGTSDEEDDFDDRNAIQKFLQLQQPSKKPSSPTLPKTPEGHGTSEADISDFLSAKPRPMEVHRGLGASPSRSTSASTHEPDSLESMGGAMLDRGRQTLSPPTTPSANLSGVGLRNSMDVASPSAHEGGRARSGSGGVTEQVARYSYTADRK